MKRLHTKNIITHQRSGNTANRVMVFLSALMLHTACQASDLFSDIHTAIGQFVSQQAFPFNNASVSITSLEQNLRLSPCQRQLFVEFSQGARQYGHTSVAISCHSPQQWKIHVPVFIDGEVDSVLARQPIPRGTVLSEDLLTTQTITLSQLPHGYFASLQNVIGMESSRNIRAGQVISPGQVKARKWVYRGQAVSIVAESGALSLSIQGKALADGQPGQIIKVRNLSSNKIIHGRVSGPGKISINI